MNENLIDRYLLNLLSPEEKIAFEAQLKKDKTLSQEVNEHRELLDDIEGIGRLELKSKLKGIHKELKLDNDKPNSKIRTLFYRVAVAAVSLGVLSVGWWHIQQTPSNAELYSQNFEPFELSLIQRSESESVIRSIESLYIDGKYAQAIPLFQNALKNSTNKSSQMLLGLGISYLETDQPKKAIEQFETIITNKDFNFEDEAEWYLSLTYLKIEDTINAKLHLDNLASDSKRDHHESAQKLLSLLAE